MEKHFDAIVIGGGHAGAEASHMLAFMGHKTALLTLTPESLGYMACNPNVGGTAKGHLVREVDALGGIMGRLADRATIQTRMLNLGNGAAVQSLRNQVDKALYHRLVKKELEDTENLSILEAEVVEILVDKGHVTGIKTAMGDTYYASVIVIATGVYLNSKVIIGDFSEPTGPSGFKRASHLTGSLLKLGLDLRRFKTGTPPRILSRGVNFSVMEPQSGDTENQTFSLETETPVLNSHVCYLTYTNLTTHKIILDNLDRAPLYNGNIKGTGPRYCPSIEDKVVRFADKDRHQIFVEPEGADTAELYVQGLSTSMPHYIQEQMLHSIRGLENAQITRYGYAIEYDCLNPEELLPTLQTKRIAGLFSAGQINGSSGYEEAAAQGIIAGINASLALRATGCRPYDNTQGQSNVGTAPCRPLPPALILKRSEAYIGVLIDDLVTKGTNEPYRMMTSRAEHRLHLRQDNADLRLTPIAITLGTVTEKRKELFNKKLAEIADIETSLSTKQRDALKRPDFTHKDLLETAPVFAKFAPENLRHVEIKHKYAGYLRKEETAIRDAERLEETQLDIQEYKLVQSLRTEAIQKLNKIKPMTLAQASRISGVTPADITCIILHLKKSRG